MAGKKNGAVTDEVEDRLDELFMEGEEDEDAWDEKNQQSKSPELQGLKAVVLSIDWEINDEIMNSLMEQIEALKQVHKKDRILLLFLQLLGSVGKYIKANKANAHPDSIKLLSSVYRSFEKVLLSEDMPDAKRKKILQAEVNRFKELKEQISLKRPAPVPGKMDAARSKKAEETAERAPKKARTEELPEAGQKAASGDSRIPPELEIVLNEVKQTIQSEFKALRMEMKKWFKRK